MSSSLITEKTQFRLSPERLDSILSEISKKLKNRAVAVYIFGSAATGHFNADSDIDLIIIKDSCTQAFVQRAFEFADLFEVYPKLDILVYTPSELDQQLADAATGFWKSVRESMRPL